MRSIAPYSIWRQKKNWKCGHDAHLRQQYWGFPHGALTDLLKGTRTRQMPADTEAHAELKGGPCYSLNH